MMVTLFLANSSCRPSSRDRSGDGEIAGEGPRSSAATASGDGPVLSAESELSVNLEFNGCIVVWCSGEVLDVLLLLTFFWMEMLPIVVILFWLPMLGWLGNKGLLLLLLGFVPN
jgi:hypothetical protein